MRGKVAGSRGTNEVGGNYNRINSAIAQTFAQKCKMGSLAAPHLVHSSARADAEGVKRGSLDRSDLKRNSALIVRRSHYNLLVPIYRALQAHSYSRARISVKRKIPKVGSAGGGDRSLRKTFATVLFLIPLTEFNATMRRLRE